MERHHSASHDNFIPSPIEVSGRVTFSNSQRNEGASGRLPRGKMIRRDRPPKFYRIGEIVDYSGVSRQTIHNYTTMGLIYESDWTRGGHRLYGENVFERLDTIAFLRTQRKSLDFIKEYFVQLDSGKDA